MRMKKHIFLFYILFFSLNNAAAQTYYANIKIKNHGKDKARREHLRGYINNRGEITYLEKEDETIYPLHDGLGAIKKNGQLGFIDTHGNIIIPVMYDDAKGFSEGLAAVKQNGKWGYINKKNEMVITPTLIYNGPFINKTAYYIDETVMKNNLYKFIDTTGKFINDEHYIDAHAFSDNCAWVKDRKTRDWGCINVKGEYIIQPLYSDARFFTNGRCIVKTKGKWGCINKKGEFVIEPLYEDMNDEVNGYYWGRKLGYWGMLDSTGKLVIPHVYKYEAMYKLTNELAYRYSTLTSITVGFSPMGVGIGFMPKPKAKIFAIPENGILPFNSGNKSGFVNLAFKTVIEPIFDDVTSFIDGIAAVKLGEKWGLIDSTGKLLCDYKYKNITFLGHGLYCSEESSEHIYIFDKSGDLISKEFFTTVGIFE